MLHVAAADPRCCCCCCCLRGLPKRGRERRAATCTRAPPPLPLLQTLYTPFSLVDSFMFSCYVLRLVQTCFPLNLGDSLIMLRSSTSTHTSSSSSPPSFHLYLMHASPSSSSSCRLLNEGLTFCSTTPMHASSPFPCYRSLNAGSVFHSFPLLFLSYVLTCSSPFLFPCPFFVSLHTHPLPSYPFHVVIFFPYPCVTPPHIPPRFIFQLYSILALRSSYSSSPTLTLASFISRHFVWTRNKMKGKKKKKQQQQQPDVFLCSAS